MSTIASTHRPSLAARRAGYIIAVGVNLALAYVINVWPGWDAVPFLTADTQEVLGLVNVSLAAGIVANAAYVVHDAPWARALGDFVTAGIGLAVLARIWQVFPFDFPDASFDWALLARFVLVVGIVGAALGLIVQFVVLLRHALKA